MRERPLGTRVPATAVPPSITAWSAVGARIRIGPVQTGPWARVVGIVGDIRDLGPDDTVRAIAFGALALVGVYGLTASFVVARSREFGIRLALGAPHDRVLGEAMRRGITLTALGLIVGLPASAMVTRLFASLIYGVRFYDPAVYLGVTLALGLTAVVATGIPAWRATRVDPAIVLRSE